jgi:hypothetical protein
MAEIAPDAEGHALRVTPDEPGSAAAGPPATRCYAALIVLIAALTLCSAVPGSG